MGALIGRAAEEHLLSSSQTKGTRGTETKTMRSAARRSEECWLGGGRTGQGVWQEIGWELGAWS